MNFLLIFLFMYYPNNRLINRMNCFNVLIIWEYPLENKQKNYQKKNIIICFNKDMRQYNKFLSKKEIKLYPMMNYLQDNEKCLITLKDLCLEQNIVLSILKISHKKNIKK